MILVLVLPLVVLTDFRALMIDFPLLKAVNGWHFTLLVLALQAPSVLITFPIAIASISIESASRISIDWNIKQRYTCKIEPHSGNAMVAGVRAEYEPSTSRVRAEYELERSFVTRRAATLQWQSQYGRSQWISVNLKALPACTLHSTYQYTPSILPYLQTHSDIVDIAGWKYVQHRWWTRSIKHTVSSSTKQQQVAVTFRSTLYCGNDG